MLRKPNPSNLKKRKYWILSIPHTAPPKIINEGYFSRNKKNGLLINSLDVWMLGMRWHTIVHLCIFHMGHTNSCHALAWPPLPYLTFVLKEIQGQLKTGGKVLSWEIRELTFKKAVGGFFEEKNKIRELPETKPLSRQCNHKAYPRCRCHSSQRESSRACVITIYGITHMATLCWYVVVKTHCVCASCAIRGNRGKTPFRVWWLFGKSIFTHFLLPTTGGS